MRTENGFSDELDDDVQGHLRLTDEQVVAGETPRQILDAAATASQDGDRRTGE